MAGVFMFPRFWTVNHMASKVLSVTGSVAKRRGYSIGIKPGYYCSLAAIQTTSNTTATPGAKPRSVPVEQPALPRERPD